MIEMDTTNGTLRLTVTRWTSSFLDDFVYISNPQFPLDNDELHHWEEQLYAQMMGWC